MTRRLIVAVVALWATVGGPAAARAAEECAVRTPEGVRMSVKCHVGCNATLETCRCTTCPCYGLFECTCNRGSGGCVSPCLFDRKGTECEVDGDGADLGPSLMVVFISFALVGLPITICIFMRVWDCNERRMARRHEAKLTEVASAAGVQLTVL